jgi:hypothetical protein
VQSDLNPADLQTRGTAVRKDLGPSSFHQKGPYFLSSPREMWPVTRCFVPVEIPEDEVRRKDVIICAALRSKQFGEHTVNRVRKIIENMAKYRNCINKVHRILARVLRGWANNPDMKKIITNPEALTVIAEEPIGDEIEKAKHILLMHGMLDTAQAVTEGRLASLLPAKKSGLIVTAGRLGERNLSRLLGVSHLPVLMAKSRVAFLYMTMAHQGE